MQREFGYGTLARPAARAALRGLSELEPVHGERIRELEAEIERLRGAA